MLQLGIERLLHDARKRALLRNILCPVVLLHRRCSIPEHAVLGLCFPRNITTLHSQPFHAHGNEKEHSTTAHRHATVVAEQSAIRNQNGLRHLNTVVERQKMLLDASRLLKLIVHDMLRSHQKQLATTSEQRRQNCLPRFPNDTNGFGSVLVVSTIRGFHFVVPQKNAVIARGDENVPSTSNRKE